MRWYRQRNVVEFPFTPVRTVEGPKKISLVLREDKQKKPCRFQGALFSKLWWSVIARSWTSQTDLLGKAVRRGEWRDTLSVSVCLSALCWMCVCAERFFSWIYCDYLCECMCVYSRCMWRGETWAVSHGGSTGNSDRRLDKIGTRSLMCWRLAYKQRRRVYFINSPGLLKFITEGWFS